MDKKHAIIKVDGLVIKEAPYKEYDKLLTLLTKEYGKINVYAFSVRRENSKNISKTRPFTFSTYELKKENDIYILVSTTLKASFDELTSDYDDVCYASYFLELIDYFSFENVESKDLYVLLYYTFKALIKKDVNRSLIKRVFELKVLKYQGIYMDTSELKYKSLSYTWDFILKTEPKNLYTFKLSKDIEKMFFDVVDLEMKEKVNRRFKSLNGVIDD